MNQKLQSESIVSQKFTKIHMIKMIKFITGLNLKESIGIFDAHINLESLNYAYNTPRVVQGREKIQDDLLCKMMNNNITRQLDKEINRLEYELDRLRELRCCEQEG